MNVCRNTVFIVYYGCKVTHFSLNIGIKSNIFNTLSMKNVMTMLSGLMSISSCFLLIVPRANCIICCLMLCSDL